MAPMTPELNRVNGMMAEFQAQRDMLSGRAAQLSGELAVQTALVAELQEQVKTLQAELGKARTAPAVA